VKIDTELGTSWLAFPAPVAPEIDAATDGSAPSLLAAAATIIRSRLRKLPWTGMEMKPQTTSRPNSPERSSASTRSADESGNQQSGKRNS